MSRVVHRPPVDSLPYSATRYFVGLRLAWFYREGTMIAARDGRLWVNRHDHEFDSFPWWEVASTRDVTPPSATPEVN